VPDRRVYYNEIDKFAAAWLRELMKAGQIPEGEVDERDIRQVQPADVRGFVQCHFFAGIGGWAYALRLAGWPDDRPVWTGSCPCQPYSVATSLTSSGPQGSADARDLWPTWVSLIRKCNPNHVFGEQVRSAISWGWWDRASLDLEEAGYACAPIVLSANAFGANHERRRLYWVAHSSSSGRKRHQPLTGVSGGETSTFSVDGNPLVRAQRALAGDFSNLLFGNGLSVAVERRTLKGYGNAIVPQVAAAFIEAYLEATHAQIGCQA
jgi:DNA (cytosine-5)-methyltransferase 1